MPQNPDTVVTSSTQARIRVLVIDDDPLYRNLLSTVLGKKYDISVACDGLEGLAKARELTPDLAVIDVQMPGLDGLQTLTAIRADAALTSAKVIMLTADASRDTVFAAVRAGADDYLIKTAFSKDELVRKIERLLRWERQPATQSATSASHPHPSAPRGPHLTGGLRGLSNAPVVAPSADETIAPGVIPKPAVDQSHLQEILDSWE